LRNLKHYRLYGLIDGHTSPHTTHKLTRRERLSRTKTSRPNGYAVPRGTVADSLVPSDGKFNNKYPLGSPLKVSNISPFSRVLSSLIGIVALASVLVTQARADGTLATLSWETYDNKDALTQRVAHEVISEATFPSGSLVQTIAKCAPMVEDKRYPGVVILVTTFKKGGTEASPFAWRNKRVSFPILINEHPLSDRSRSVVTTSSENPRANIMPIGFYDPAAGELYALGNQPAMMKLQALSKIAEMERIAKMGDFIAETGGTLPDLLQATSFRVQLLLADGTTNAVEINPQDRLLKAFVEQCNSRIQGKGAR
jgi:hypothetical protein